MVCSMFSCGYWPFVYLLWRMLDSGPFPLFNRVVCLFVVQWKKFPLYMFWVLTPYQKYNLQIFSSGL